MPRLQRNATAIAALTFAFVVAACGAADRRAASITGVQDTASDTSSTVAASDAAFASGETETDDVAAALADGDLCGVYLGLAAFDLSMESTSGLMAQLERIHDVMRSAAALVPDELAADWGVITDGTADLLETLAKGKKFAAEHFDDEEYQRAASRIADWMVDNCA